MPSNERMLGYAMQIRSSFAERYNRIEKIYKHTRLRVRPDSQIQGRNIQTAPTAEALALLMQFLSFTEMPRATVLPKDNTQNEDERTTRIEQWFAGYPRALKFTQMHPFTRAMYDYAETGIGALLLDFDESRAVMGKFPFRVTAPPPLSLAFQLAHDEIVAATVMEMRQIGALYNDLHERLEYAVKPKWSIPPALEKANTQDPLGEIETLVLYTDEAQYLWVAGEMVWEKPHLCSDVPLDVLFCNAVPSDHPEEYGFGLIYPALDMLVQRQINLDGASTGLNYFTFPLERVYYQDGGVQLRQVKPGASYEGVAKIEDVPIQPNYQSQQYLAQEYKDAIGKLTLQDVTFGEGTDTSSGYQVSLLQEGPRRKITKLIGGEASLDGAALGFAQHYCRVLKWVETFATPEMAKELGAKGEEGVKQYLSAFSTAARPSENPAKKIKARIALTGEDVAGYGEITVSLLPESPQDENAKYQRATLAMQAGMSREGVFRNVIKVESPDQEFAWQREDMLMQDEMWKEFMTKKAIKDKLNRDKDLAREFAEFAQAKAEESQNEAEIPQEQTPMDMGMEQMPPMMPQDMGNGAMPMDMQGMSPDVMPPSEMGQLPPDPAMLAMQQQFPM